MKPGARDTLDFPPYLPFYKLQAAPFSSEADPRYFYTDSERAEQLDMLQQFTEYGGGLVVLLGQEGVGKSMLLEKFLDRSGEDWRLCRIDGENGVDLDTLLQRVVESFAFDLTSVAPEHLFDALRTRLDELSGLQTSVLLVDDAHELSDDALEMVCHLATMAGTNDGLMRVLLFGDESLDSRLAEVRYSQIVTPQRLQLQPLSETDCEAYLTLRLKKAGYRGPLPFEASQIAQIYHDSEGVPARLNQEAHALLLHRYKGSGLLGTSRRAVVAVIVALAALAGILLLAELVAERAENGSGREASSTQTMAIPIRAQGEEQQPASQVSAELGSRVETEAAKQKGELVAQPSTALTATAEESVPLVIKGTGAEGTSAATAGEVVEEKLTLSGVSPDPVVGSTQPQRITVLGSSLQPHSRVAMSSAGKVLVLEPSQIVVRDSMHMDLTVTVGVEPESWAIQVSSPSRERSNMLRFQVIAPPAIEGAKPLVVKSESDAQARPGATALPPPVTTIAVQKKEPDGVSGKVLGQSWIRGQGDTHYTIQIMASIDPRAVERLLAAHPQLSSRQLARFEKLQDGKRLHVLITGSYATRQQAEGAAAALPAKLDPWIRDFAGIKQVMVTSTVSLKQGVHSGMGEIRDTAWAWSQNPNHFTIQLLAASDEVALEAAMREMGLAGELAVVETQRNGQPWYSLIYGSFTKRETAEETITRLSEKLKRTRPWVRKFSRLQSEIGKEPLR